jgi:DNA primase
VIPGSFLQDLLARIDVVELVGRTVALKKAGINYKGLCPFHGEKSPSFTVSPTRQTYHCFGCGVHGDAIRFLCEHHGMGFVDAVKDLAQQVGMTVPEDDATPEERAESARKRELGASLSDVLARACDHYKAQLRASPRAIDYLKGRGLSGEIAARFALGYSPDSWRTLASAFPHYDDPLLAEAGLVIVSGDDPAAQKRYDRFRDRVMFPIRNVKGEIIGFGGRILDKGEPKYLNSPETPVFVKGRELYGLFEARQGLRERGYALVTEGYMDVVALAQLGFPNAVATLGTACTADHVRQLLRFTEQVVFSFDGDAAGRRAAGRALEASLPHATDTRSFRFLFLPPEHDPDSYIREHGAPAFEEHVRKAIPLSQQLLEIAQRDCDMATAEGRARMLAQARPLWSALPDGALRRQLLGELALKGGLPVDELAHLWEGGERASRGSKGAAPAFDEHGLPASDGGQGRSRGPWESRGGLFGGKYAARDREKAEHAALRRLPRSAPKTPEARAIEILFGHSEFWERLSDDEHALLHALPAPHGLLVAWLEGKLLHDGPLPWAVLSHAVRDDPALDAAARQAADGDAHPDATFDDFRRTIDLLLERVLKAESDALAKSAVTLEDLGRLRAVNDHLKDVKARLSTLPPSDDSEV